MTNITRVSAALAGISLILAWQLRTNWHDWIDPYGYLLIGFWVAVPPAWFLADYTYWRPAEKEDERARHFHDLARNLWLALVALLGAMMGIKFAVSVGG